MFVDWQVVCARVRPVYVCVFVCEAIDIISTLFKNNVHKDNEAYIYILLCTLHYLHFTVHLQYIHFINAIIIWRNISEQFPFLFHSFLEDM